MTAGGYISANVDLAFSGFGVASAMLLVFGVASTLLGFGRARGVDRRPPSC